ncbi:hypothetical protein [Microvirga guangxiensis]|uniref:Uncharacterized protein n=1 Tax=Microvirga guangxiensis TaxID=549386 RepID=A0A1G5H1A7_9HYPH|nr:hypothetical protein [Microvirga guangxiensis]SCY57652.1 hypothetical protein SAMN02927923_01731 [Microvirga guangxiensis]
MTRSRAILNAVILFGGVCLLLGVPGMIMIDSWRVLAIYAVAVLGFAAWVSRETYQGSRTTSDRLKS